jgi:hypothetical protein
MQIKKGDKIRVTEDTIFRNRYPKGSEGVVGEITADGLIWLEPLDNDSNAFWEKEVELIERAKEEIGDNKEYIEMRGVDPDEEESPKKTNTEDLIIQECDAIKELLLQKNKRYGDSATKRGVVYDLDPVIAIQARINDKISRLKNQHGEDEDVELDLMGYFILLRIAKKMRQ